MFSRDTGFEAATRVLRMGCWARDSILAPDGFAWVGEARSLLKRTRGVNRKGGFPSLAALPGSATWRWFFGALARTEPSVSL